ncbi:hypothetical protein COOONC_18203 [Cooperia oncophora]
MKEVQAGAVKLGNNVMEHIAGAKETFTQFIEEPRRRAEADSLSKEQPYLGHWDHQHTPPGNAAYGQVAEQWPQPVSQPRPVMPPMRKISREDEQALLRWELERQRLEDERLAKLQDHEVGGEESDMASFLPASHISFPSQTTGEGPLEER